MGLRSLSCRGGAIITVSIQDDFDLAKIADSGQCFRWFPCFDNGYMIQAGSRILQIRPALGRPSDYDVSCTSEEWNGFWSSYLDLQTDYASIRKRIHEADDPYLYAAAAVGRGIRILRQDPWETLITFIISQRKSIPAIRTCVEKLCAAAGEKLSDSPDGREHYSFPSPKALASLSMEDLTACSLGYRARYIAAVSSMAADGSLDFAKLQDLDDPSLCDQLMELRGVGIKVASCTMLFGFHRLNAFPEDVWVKRLLQEHYPNGFPFRQYAPYNGVMQQYLFCYRRQE